MRSPITLALAVSILPFQSQAMEEATPEVLIQAMQEGGVVIFIRHTSTETDYADQVSADPLNCATQRTLSEAGWQDAIKIGESFAYFDIPVDEVISSQYCRAWQTASLAFGTYEKNPALNFEPAEEYTDAQIATMRDGVMGLMLLDLADGENRILVGHDDPFEPRPVSTPSRWG